ncbi:MAG TPA: hypothetical protein PLW65_25595, partial [Pseudomonadota bacterium]|nr:hypothetical protein [Pseudomonadota bacterium]
PALAAVLLGEGPTIAAALGEGGALAGLVGGTEAAPVVQLAVELAPGGHLAAVRAWLQQLLGSGRIVGATLAGPALRPELLGAAAIDLGDGAAELGSLWASADGFAQASRAGHEVLPRVVGELVGAPAAGGRWPRLVELYAGSGNLTRALRSRADYILAIEGDPAAAARLRRLLAASPPAATPVEVVSAPVERALAARAGTRFDVAVLDPPPTGARAALAALTRLAVRRVVYVSCDAMTLGRDLLELRAAGLRPRSVQPLDLMPHTAQVECVAVLDAP